MVFGKGQTPKKKSKKLSINQKKRGDKILKDETAFFNVTCHKKVRKDLVGDAAEQVEQGNVFGVTNDVSSRHQMYIFFH